MSVTRVTVTPEIPGATAPGTPAPEAPPSATTATPEASAGERPTWLPEKFKSAEDLATAYAELEKKQSQPAPKAGEQAPPATPPAGEQQQPAAQTPEQQAAAQAVQGAGLKLDALQSEFAEKGELSADSLATLEKAGIPKATVDAYIAGQQALAERMVADIYATAGGEQEFQAMTQWAAASLSPQEIAAFNNAVAGGDMAAAKLAVQGLKARHGDAVGTKATRTVEGNGNDAATGDSYESWTQVTADMAKPEYRSDPAFRAKVAQKLQRSNVR